jgi:hypothetical protein
MTFGRGLVMRLASNDLPGQNLEATVITLALINWTLLRVNVECARCLGIKRRKRALQKMSLEKQEEWKFQADSPAELAGTTCEMRSAISVKRSLKTFYNKSTAPAITLT